MRISRELEGVGRAMNSMTTQNNLMDFLNDQENSQRLNGLVEDIRYSLINYRVCTLKHTLIISNIHFRLHYNKISMMKTVRLLVSLPYNLSVCNKLQIG